MTAQQYNFQYYSVKEGLPQSQVYSILEDRNGYLWMGTDGGGLSRFDGENFETFSVIKSGLINNYVDAIYEANDRLYIGARNGISVYDGNTFQNYYISKEESIAVNAFHWYQGKLLVGTSRGVYEFDGQEFKYSRSINGTRRSNIYCFFEDSRNRLWIGTKAGALLLQKERRTAFRSAEDFTKGEVSSICEDQKGNIWLATYNGVFIYDGVSFSHLDVEDGLTSNFLNAVHCDQKGNIWLGTQNSGVSIWNPLDSTIIALNAETGLCNNNVSAFEEDAWGGMWIATSGGGVCKYAGQQFLHVNISERPADNLVYSLCQDTTGTMWLAAADDGIVRLDSSGYTRFGKKEGFVNSKTKSMLRDSKGRLWFGTNDNGLAFYNGQSFEFLQYRNNPLARFCKDLKEDKQGNIWAASSLSGVYKIVPKDSLIQIEEILIDSFLINDSLVIRQDTLRKDSFVFTYRVDKIRSINNNINAIHFDGLGRLWFASPTYGLGYYTENGAKTITTSLGLPEENIRSIIEDEKGHLWIGTAGYGVARINLYADSLDLRVYTEKDGLSSANVYLMAFDSGGDLWVGCGRGVDRLTLDEEQNIKSFKSYGKTDGFIGVETCQNAVLKDEAGNLWFGTIDGVTKFLPGNKQINAIPPNLQMKNVELFSKAFGKTDYKQWINADNIFKPGLELPYRQNNLSFEYLGINLSNPQKVVYQWMLQGSDQNWSKRSKQNSVNYSSLSPGKYVFKVRAYNEDMIYNDPPLEMPFEILSPIWQRWWFITIAALLLAGILVLFFRLRINQIRKKAKAEKERLEMENNLLQLEQKALQLQMNPHFIFNALNTVQSLFMSNEQGAARQLLSKFAKLMRSILENSRTSQIPLQKEIDLLDNYLAIEQFSRPGKFEYKLIIDPTIDKEEVSIPPMMIQPFVENAIIHGVNHLKSDGHIELSFQKENNQLLCMVKDNGIGREASAKIKQQEARKHESVALDVTKERLEFLNQNNNNKSLEIKDLFKEDGSAAGTLVYIRLPLEEW